MEDALGIRACPEFVTMLEEICVQIREVVRLAVEDDPQRFIFVGDGLVTALHVDDSQPPHAQSDSRFEMETIAIRAAMDNSLGHGFDSRPLRDLVICIRNSTNAAHKAILPFPIRV